MKPEVEPVTFIISKENGRIDKVLSETFEEYTRSQIQAWLKSGDITVNQASVKPNYTVQAGDTIQIVEPEPDPLNVEPEDIPLDIVYEDDAVLVVNKPTGMVVHPSKGHDSGTLVNGLLYHVQELSTGTQVIRPGIVHRIDKDTSGLLVVAKTNEAHQALAEQLQDHSMERVYYALVQGVVQHDEGTIDAPIARMTNNRLKRTVMKNGKHAVTHFKKIEELNDATLLQLQLETGRTHQIRVHMNYINHPLLGDPMYGPTIAIAPTGQYLHAGVLGFTHPVTGERMHFETPFPSYFEEKLTQLRKY